jgi:hypothetical protein
VPAIAIMAPQAETGLSAGLYISLVAIAALCGWTIVRALRWGRLELRGFVADRLRRPVLFWGLLLLCAAIPLAYLAFVLDTM